MNWSFNLAVVSFYHSDKQFFPCKKKKKKKTQILSGQTTFLFRWIGYTWLNQDKVMIFYLNFLTFSFLTPMMIQNARYGRQSNNI